MFTKRYRFSVFGLVALVSFATACSSVKTEGSEPDIVSDQALESLVSHLQARSEAAQEVSFSDTLRGHLPNHSYVVEGSKANAKLSTSLISGEVLDVIPGVGYKVEGYDADGGTITEFDDPEALWKIVEITIDSENSGLDESSAFVEQGVANIGMVVDAEFDSATVSKALEGRTVFVATIDDGFFSYDKSLPRIVKGGDLLGFVESDGSLSFPVLGHDEKRFIGDIRNLSDVKDELGRGNTVSEGRFVRG